MDLTPTKNVEKILAEVFKKIDSEKSLSGKLKYLLSAFYDTTKSMDAKTRALFEKEYLDVIYKTFSTVTKDNSFVLLDKNGPGMTLENWKKSRVAFVKRIAAKINVKDSDFINPQEKEKFIAALKLNEEKMKLYADLDASFMKKVKVDIKMPESVLKKNTDFEKYVKQLEKVPGVNRSFLESVKKQYLTLVK